MLNETVKHYDMDINFFKHFLDPYMKYTSGLFSSNHDSLELAAQRMLDTIIESGNIKSGMRVLEIGPGWGALIKRMHERGIACDYIGVSPSAVQNSYINSFCREGECLATSIFEQFDPQGKAFDAIVLIGSFCHLSDKQAQLMRMHKMLAPGGAIVIEDTFFTTSESHAKHQAVAATKFVQEKIFGFAEISSLSVHMDQVAKADLKVASMFEHSTSYKQTIDCWIRKLRLLDSDQYPKSRDFIKYMTIVQRGWNKTIQNQLLVLKSMRQN
jgi:cyclopropane-fatty-acyl-phospholipid synthase